MRVLQSRRLRLLEHQPIDSPGTTTAFVARITWRGEAYFSSDYYSSPCELLGMILNLLTTTSSMFWLPEKFTKYLRDRNNSLFTSMFMS